jgi:hypothetical protein
LEYNPRALFRGVPERFNVPQGSGLCTEVEGFFRCDLKEFCECLPDLIEGRAAKAAAEELKP